MERAAFGVGTWGGAQFVRKERVSSSFLLAPYWPAPKKPLPPPVGGPPEGWQPWQPLAHAQTRSSNPTDRHHGPPIQTLRRSFWDARIHPIAPYQHHGGGGKPASALLQHSSDILTPLSHSGIISIPHRMNIPPVRSTLHQLSVARNEPPLSTRPGATMLPNRVAAHSCPGSASQPRCGAACQVSDGLKRTDWLLGTPAPASQIPYFPRPQQARPLTPRPNQKRAVSPNPTPATSQRTVPEYTWCQWQQYGRFPVLRSSTAHVLQSHASILCCALRSDDPLPPQTTPKRCTARRIDGAGAVAVRAAQFTAWNVRPNRIRRANPATHKVPAAKTRRGLRVLPVVRLS